MIYSEIQIADALKQNDKSTLVKMINDGIAVNELVIPHHTDILLLSIIHGSHSFFDMVLNSGFNCSPSNGIKYLHHAVRTCDVYIISKIIKIYNEYLYDINETNADLETPLHIASNIANFPLSGFEMLTNAGCIWGSKDLNGNTPLHNLLNLGYPIEGVLLDYIVEHNELLELKNNFNITPNSLINSLINSDVWKINNINLIQRLNLNK